MFARQVEKLLGLSIDDLDGALGQAKRARDEAELQIAAITAVIDSTQKYADHGHRSINTYLKQQLNCSAAEARKIRSRARLINQHPSIGDALGASQIGVGQVDLLARAHRHPRAGQRFAEFAPLLTEKAEQLDYADFAIAVEHFETQADPDGAFDDQRFHEEERCASVSVTNGAVDVHASGGDPIAATEMHAIFARAVEAEAHRDFEARRAEHGDDALSHPLPRTSRQRSFDALHEIFLASVRAPADGLRPEPLVNIVIDPTTGIEALARHGLLEIEDDPTPVDPSTRRCATTTGTPLHPDVVIRAMIRGSIRRVIVDAHDVVINHGRTQRLFTGKAREAARLLAVRCGHRGCGVPAEFCDIDHVDEWAADGGPTNQANALPLCGVHDRWKHRQRLRGRRDRTGRIHLVKPDGSVIKPLGARDPEWAEPDRPTSQQTSTSSLTWAEFTAGRRQRSSGIDPAAAVEVTHLRVG